MVRRLFATAWICLSLSLAACGPSPPPTGGGDGGGGSGDGAVGVPGTLRIEPANVTLTVSNGVAATQEYRAIFTNDSGADEDVTDQAVFNILDGRLGSFDGNVFTSATDKGGETIVRASYSGELAETSLTIRLEAIVIGPGAGADAPTKFGGAEDPSRAPSFVYPANGVLVPPNLNILEFHFMPGPGNSLFELRFVGTALDLRVYLGCSPVGGGCAYEPDEAVWTLLSDAERGQEPVTYTLRGVDGTTPGTVGTSASQTIAFGADDIVGGIYYWNAGAGAIRRYEFGVSGQTAENYIDAARAMASTCVGCHQLSRDGTRIAVGMDIPSPSPYRVFDVATRDVIYSQGTMFGGGANFFAFSPDSTQILTSNGATIVWRDSTTGAAIMDPLVPSGSMPDWSHDGTRVVYADPGIDPPCFGGICGAPGVQEASIEMMPFDGTNWGSPTTLVPYTGQNNYYPTFSPDGQWVMFNRSPATADSFDAPDAQVWMIPAAGGNAVHQVTASTGGDSWPKWAPDKQNYHAGQMMWFTFSSRRAYGLRQAAGTSQIWMAAFDPARGATGDGSFPAFWLPFQEMGSGNHIAQWVTEVERQPCSNDSECGAGEFCEEGECVPLIE